MKRSIENYVDQLLNRFLRVGSLHLFEGFRGSSGLVLGLFLRKRMLESSVCLSNTLGCELKREGSLTFHFSRIDIGSMGGGI